MTTVGVECGNFTLATTVAAEAAKANAWRMRTREFGDFYVFFCKKVANVLCECLVARHWSRIL